MSGNLLNEKKCTACTMIKWLIQHQLLDNAEEIKNVMPLDAVDLIRLFRCVGFSLEKLENHPANGGPFEVTLHCGKSGTTATLTLKDTGTQEATPNLNSLVPLPSLATRSFTVAFFRHLVLDILPKEMPADVLRRTPSSRQYEWEVDPRITPPRSSSSPKPPVDVAKLREDLEQVQVLINISLEALPPRDVTFSKKQGVVMKRVSDIKPANSPRNEAPVSTPVVPRLRFLQGNGLSPASPKRLLGSSAENCNEKKPKSKIPARKPGGMSEQVVPGKKLRQK